MEHRGRLKVFRKKSLFYKYLVSYILIFLVPFTILGGLFFATAIRTVKRDVREPVRRQLEQAAYRLDEKLSELRSTAASVSYDYRLSRSGVEGDVWGDARYNLARYKAGRMFINDIVLYYRGWEKLLTTTGTTSFPVFEDGVYEIIPLGTLDFRGFLDNAAEYPISAGKFKIRDNSSGEPVIFFNYPVPAGSADPIGAVICAVREKDLLNLVKTLEAGSDGGAYLYDFNGNLIIKQKNGWEEAADSAMLSCEGESRLRIGNRSYYAGTQRTGTFGWKIVWLFDYRSFYRSVRLMEGGLVCLLLLVQSAGAGLVLMQAKRNVRPIRGILSKFGVPDTPGYPQCSGKSGTSGYHGYFGHFRRSGLPVQKGSELDLITAAIDEVVGENSLLRNQIDLQAGIIKDKKLFDLIYGRVSENDGGELRAVLGKAICDPVYFVLLFAVDNGNSEPKRNAREEFLNSAAVYNEGMNLFSVELVPESSIALIAAMENGGDLREKQERLSGVLARSAAKEKLWGTIGIGRIVTEISGVSGSYIDAKTAAEYRMANRDVAVEFFDGIADKQDEFSPYTLKEKMLFGQSLKAGNKEIAKQMLGQMAEEIRKKQPSVILARLTCMELVNVMMDVVREADMEISAESLRTVINFESMDTFLAAMNGLADRITEHMLMVKSSQTDRLVGDILEYIRSNMHSCEISLAAAAEKFGMSATVLSRLIKQNIGYTFTDYLVELRLEEAKRLLRETDLPVKDIVCRVGYVDLSSFTQKFKLKEGTTPGKYRKER